MTHDLMCADRSERGKLRVTGEQRAWFLHQILTKAFEDIRPGKAREAAMISGKGRMIGYLEALATDDAILAHFERALDPALPDAMRAYLFATRAELTSVTEDFGLVLVAGEGWAEAAVSVSEPGLIQASRGIGAPGGYLWAERGEASRVIAGLERAGARRVSDEELEAMRVVGGAPRWGHEMTERSLPPEIRLDRWALDYDKGCYLGQEVMAKIHFRGRVTKLLQRLALSEPATVGDEVRDADEQPLGRITSAAGTAALAVLKTTVGPGDVVTVAGAKAEILEEVW
ncbi:glycine cleavage T C-terminal barrel domain-containing protein [soil metagenome]